MIVIANDSANYDESYRQILLIEKVRELFPNKKNIIFALDADEIISADALHEVETWKLIRSSALGSVFLFEKPDVLPGIKQCLRWENNYFPIAFVDDLSAHKPSIIHSRRIPFSVKSEEIKISSIKILHFAISRINAQSSKMRYYSVLENINKTSPFYSRRRIYSSFFDPYMYYKPLLSSVIPSKWLEEWESKGILFSKLQDPLYSWREFKILQYFKQYGISKFYFDNIWEYNWEECLEFAKNNDIINLPNKIIKPPLFYRLLTWLIDVIYKFIVVFKNLFRE